MTPEEYRLMAKKLEISKVCVNKSGILKTNSKCLENMADKYILSNRNVQKWLNIFYYLISFLY